MNGFNPKWVAVEWVSTGVSINSWGRGLVVWGEIHSSRVDSCDFSWKDCANAIFT